MLELVAGAARAVIDLARGGRLASLIAGGAERLVTGGDRPLLDTLWGCFVMAPWVGRLEDGVLPWGGEDYRVPRNHGRHAIHGVAFDVPWELEERTESFARLALAFDDRWPLGGRVVHTIGLRADRLRFALEVAAGAAGMPAAVGWHPWFDGPERPARVRLVADGVLETDDDLVPTGRTRAIEGDVDLSAGPVVGDRRLDHVYVGARGPALVEWADLRLIIDLRPPLTTAVVYTPADAVCVEPVTAWPNAPVLAARGVAGTGLVGLGPGERFVADMEWTWGPVS